MHHPSLILQFHPSYLYTKLIMLSWLYSCCTIILLVHVSISTHICIDFSCNIWFITYSQKKWYSWRKMATKALVSYHYLWINICKAKSLLYGHFWGFVNDWCLWDCRVNSKYMADIIALSNLWRSIKSYHIMSSKQSSKPNLLRTFAAWTLTPFVNICFTLIKKG